MKYRDSFPVQAPPATVAGFHAQASSRGAITLPSMPMRLEHGRERLSSTDEMAYTLGLGPIPVRWVARLEDRSGADRVNRQQTGPLEAWTYHHWIVMEDGGATRAENDPEAEQKRHHLWRPAELEMWLGLPLLFAYRGWKTRRPLEAPPSSSPMKTR